MFAHKSALILGSIDAGDMISLVKNGGYELAHCEYSFEQGYDDTGKVQTTVYGGVLHVRIPSLPPTQIIEWAIQPRKYYDGAIVVMDNELVTDEKIFFEEGACIRMKIDYTQTGENFSETILAIQARKLFFSNGVTFKNEWNFW